MGFQPDSAYLTTKRVNEGKYHWVLVTTNSQCLGARHHWIGISSSTGREAYKQEYIGSLSTLSEEAPPLLGYFCIAGWIPPPNETLEETCHAVFTESYATAITNRMNHISSRTWVFAVLKQLQERGFIERESVVSLEHKIVRRSNELAKVTLSLQGEEIKECVVEEV